MYVAYNRYYQPGLTTVENATLPPIGRTTKPGIAGDTGLLGLVTYLGLFGSIFYYGLKWLGLVTTARQRNLFLLLYLGGGAASAVVFVLWKGAAFFGVGLPFGMIIGLILYLILISLFGHYQLPKP
jgi:hypothetical protein